MLSLHKSNFNKYKSLHCNAILSYCNRPTNRKYITTEFDAAIAQYFNGIVSNFQDLLLASPELLFQIKEKYDNLSPKFKKEICSKLSLIGLYDRFIKKEDAFFLSDNKSIYNSDYLIGKIDVATCPYCNEVNLHSFYSNSRKSERRNFDWDHFIPKDEYPFLAISFFNLVPACKVCNFLKKAELVRLNPHENFEVNELFKFYVTGKSIDILKHSEDIELAVLISTSPNGKKIEEIIDTVCLDSRYASQKNFIFNVLNKKRIYHSPLWPSISNIIYQNGYEQTDINRLLFTEYTSSHEYYKSPFSKLTSDLLKGK